MSNHRNHRRDEHARTEHGPTWENSNPGKGCNSTHVARARRAWKRLEQRALRRTGRAHFGFHGQRTLPTVEDELEMEGVELEETDDA